MKRKNRLFFTFFCSFLLFNTCLSAAEGLLPDIASIFGVPVPSFADVVDKPPISIKKTEEGDVYQYNEVSDIDYYAYGEELKESGCDIVGYTSQNEEIVITLSLQMHHFFVRYDVSAHVLEVTYPEGTYDMAKTAVITPTPKPDIVQGRKIVIFGSYEQDNDLQNGKEAIEWLLLKQDGDKCLLLSKDILDCYRFHEKQEIIEWKTSQIYKWLNKDFLQAAFSPEEQKRIIAVNQKSERKLIDKYSRQKDAVTSSKDKVFLLSANEANDLLSPVLGAFPSPYAVSKGLKADRFCYWWLRDINIDETTTSGYQAKAISQDGKTITLSTRYSSCGIRPCIWIDMK